MSSWNRSIFSHILLGTVPSCLSWPTRLSCYAPATRVVGIKQWCTSDVCLSCTSGLSLEQERPRKTKIGTEIGHVTRDSDTTFKVKMSKINLQGAGHIVAVSHTACYISLIIRLLVNCHIFYMFTMYSAVYPSHMFGCSKFSRLTSLKLFNITECSWNYLHFCDN